MRKRILVIGQGGREHALVWKLAQSPEVEKIYAAPGNPGIAELAECVDIAMDDQSELLMFAWNNQIDLTIVGPEGPLMAGIVDLWRDHDLNIFGPTAEAAQLEGSKVFTKNLLKRYKIPTASYEAFDSLEPAMAYARSFTDNGQKVVIKADGLAAGKGVIIATNEDEARAALVSMMEDHSFGAAGDKVVVEEFLEGEEVSFFAITDGTRYIPLIAAQDHKQVFDGDQGPNTGGMGAYVNPPVFTEALQAEVEARIIKPVIRAMEMEGCPYQGVLYAGLMITSEGPKVLEFNARFGDPETQAIMPMIKGDLLPVLEQSAFAYLTQSSLEMETGSSVCVVLASGGYPGKYQTGLPIEGLDQHNSETLVFHAGTAENAGQIVTNGGRVLNVVCRGNDIHQAIDKVYQEVGQIRFEGMHYRKDIGRKALQREA